MCLFCDVLYWSKHLLSTLISYAALKRHVAISLIKMLEDYRHCTIRAKVKKQIYGLCRQSSDCGDEWCIMSAVICSAV